MILKLCLIGLFICSLTYGAVRPFTSVHSKLFVITGSFLGLISVIDISYVDSFAGMLGIQSGKDLYLYVALVTIFLFVYFTFEKFTRLENKIKKIVKRLAIEETKD